MLSRLIPSLRADWAAARALAERLHTWNPRDTASAQLALVRETWRDAVADVPYYQRLVAEGQAPAQLGGWDEFRALPELNRRILQEHGKEFIRRSGPPPLSRSTAGSTGNPVKFGVQPAEDRILRVLKLVLWQRAGYDLEARLFLIWGHSHLLGTGWRRHLRHLQRKGKDALLGYRRVDAYSLSPEIAGQYGRAILRCRPAGLIGYASALDYVVRVLPELRSRFQQAGCRFVMPCAEPPPKLDSLALLRETFRCPVLQEFGGVDFGQVAMKFDEEPFEVFPEHNILEAVPVPGETGHAALVTTLYPRYTPLIRYRQGDVLGGCEVMEHGHVRSFVTLEGRINDMLPLSSGRQVHSVALFHCIHQEPVVLNIQMALEDAGPRLRLVATDGYDAACEQRIRHRLGQIAPELASAPIERVVDLETNRAGKRRWFVDHRSAASGVPAAT